MFAAKDTLLTRPSGGYQISRSVRLRASASAYLNRTSGTPTSQNIYTISFWIKRGKLGASQEILGAGTVATDAGRMDMLFNSDDTITIAGGLTVFRKTNAVFRDPSAWYHIVLSVSLSGTVNLYVNNVTQTFSTSNTWTTSAWNAASTVHRFGYDGSGSYFDGYLTEINFIDGQALTPSSFGETNAITGVWQPKAYSGTYGTNGFYLNFSDPTSTTTIGNDYSGNGNNWTTNNISVTAGATYDSMLDVPTPYADGGNGRGNYAVLSPLGNGTSTAVSAQLANANLRYSGATSGGCTGSMAIPSGTYYFEATLTTIVGCGVGIATDARNLQSDFGTVVGNWYGWYVNPTITLVNNATTTTWTGNTISNGTVVNVAIDATNPASVKLWLGKANVWYDSSAGTTGNPATGANPTITITANVALYPVVGFFNGGTSTVDFNFGQRPFTYTPPTGFVALNTQNLPTPTISNGASYMAATTYTGTGSALTIANTVGNASFQPDLVWVKGRSGATDHALYDAVRGVQLQLESNTTTDETTETTGLTAFGSTGFTVGALAQMNTSAATYVAWQWKEGATQGFDIVTYTGNGSARTISHNLGVVPNMIIVKARTTASTDQGWPVYHSANTAAPETDYLLLNSTAATADLDTVWNDTAPTSSVFSVGTNANVNANNDTYVAYCFAAVAGYSAFGSYTGNGSADGPFVFLGFRPRFIMWKNSSAVEAWLIEDTARSTYNQVALELYPSSSGAEAAGSSRSPTQQFDFLSNGFKVRGAQGQTNGSGNTIIYAAFCENPFKNSLAR